MVFEHDDRNTSEFIYGFQLGIISPSTVLPSAFAAEKTYFSPQIRRRPAQTGSKQQKETRSGVDDLQNQGKTPEHALMR